MHMAPALGTNAFTIYPPLKGLCGGRAAQIPEEGRAQSRAWVKPYWRTNNYTTEAERANNNWTSSRLTVFTAMLPSRALKIRLVAGGIY